MTEKRCRAMVAERALGRCERCGAPDPVHMHHRLPAGRGGAWTPGNILHICLFCHDWVHGNPIEAYKGGWLIRSERASPEDVPVLVRGTWQGHRDDGTVQLSIY